ncbi:MAG: hypothetical protein KAJ24_02460 [Candidatus Aenigmarchaeota archaeon]|nr:hypothetical protein [Candidatus Aenigmarchaeota archaeon]
MTTIKEILSDLKEAVITSLRQLKPKPILLVFISFCIIGYVFLDATEIDYTKYSLDAGAYIESLLIVSVIIYFLIFDMVRRTKKHRFDVFKALKFFTMLLIMTTCIIAGGTAPAYLAQYVLSETLLSNAYSDIAGNYLGNYAPETTKLLAETLMKILHISLLLATFIYFMLFYGPFIQYAENRGILKSFKKSIMLFLEKPVQSTAGILVSFLLFIIPSVIFASPFIFAFSPVYVHSVSIYPLIFMPISIAPIFIGMIIGLILRQSFIITYYENSLQSKE